jgi:hypothetical protein
MMGQIDGQIESGRMKSGSDVESSDGTTECDSDGEMGDDSDDDFDSHDGASDLGTDGGSTSEDGFEPEPEGEDDTGSETTTYSDAHVADPIAVVILDTTVPAHLL